ncbi:MAG: serine hydrolase [Clostridium sp.]|nr:serine hydrolase [Clostridiaceae bacterium]MDY5483142.1 serine hydrolase [Clostridium sp.]
MKRNTYKTKKWASLILAAVLAAGAPASSAFAAYGPASESAGAQSQTSQGTETITSGAVPLTAAPTEAAQPEIAAEGAVLYDATHGTFLFEKNPDQKFYPASITKLMTALLVAERCGMDQTVTFSETAVTKLESGAVTLNLKAGDQVSVKDCMYGLLLKSANEVANGLAEHVSGSISAFSDLMNQKAASLGCTNTHFVNPNGLNNSDHYTTAHDMALIASTAFNNATVRQVASTLKYEFPATKAVSYSRTLTMGHKMLDPARTEYYPGIVGGKTGFTSLAGNTLVTCAEQNGTRLIAVILKSRQTHYSDTKKLLDYGFEVVKGGSSPETNPGGSGAEAVNPGGSGAAAVYPGTISAVKPAGAEDTASASVNGPGASAVLSSMVHGREAYPAAEGRWISQRENWKFQKSDGSYAGEEYLRIHGEVYGFAKDGMMLTGWHLVNGTWHYFDASGAMAFSRWIETNQLWYYVDEDGSLFVNGTTPDGYRVDGNGVWIS